MTSLSLSELSSKMADIDFVMFSTVSEGGEIAARPMSNNGDVDYDGNSFFFADEESRVVADVARSPKVGLSMQGAKGLLGKPPIFISIEGDAELIRDRAALEEHWTPDLERWWPDGAATPGVVLIKVHASRIHYWDGEDNGEITV